jgi:hypothetical protein
MAATEYDHSEDLLAAYYGLGGALPALVGRDGMLRPAEVRAAALPEREYQIYLLADNSSLSSASMREFSQEAGESEPYQDKIPLCARGIETFPMVLHRALAELECPRWVAYRGLSAQR